MLTGNDVYRKNAWMAVYEMKAPIADAAAAAAPTRGRRAAWRIIKRGLKNLGEPCVL